MTLALVATGLLLLAYGLLVANARVEAKRRREFNRKWYEHARSQTHGEWDR